MFIGHNAIGFASKRLAPRTSLGMLMAAPILLDLLWPIFLSAGVEKVRIDPGNTKVTPLDFVSYPWSHSLAMSLVWAALFAGGYVALTRYPRGGIVIFFAVISHWLCDAIVHRPDLPLTPLGHARIGLGLWNSPLATGILETAMFGIGVSMYARMTRPLDRTGRYALCSFVALLLLLYFPSLAGQPPPNRGGVAGHGLFRLDHAAVVRMD